MNPLLTSYTAAVWWRNFLTWKKLFWPSMASNIANPLLFLFAFGFGLGSIVGEIGEISYLAFIVPGMVVNAAMFSASFETTISAFARFNMQKTWDATLSTPVRLSELLMGELIWATSKAMLAAVVVVIVGGAWGGIPSIPGALLVLPVLVLATASFAAYGLLGTAYARSWDLFSYYFTFWVTPNFVFAGVFFDIQRFPPMLETLVWALPVTHLLAVIRPLMTGTELGLAEGLGHLLYPCVLGVVAFWLALRKLERRMFD